jgi:2-amino-4-hydroxy-6-hydroxymethyldihydropteridine diphosphokinase
VGSPRARVVRSYVGLGANLGDAAATLGEAIRALAAVPDLRLRGVSRLYATTPVGVVNQPEFRNAVVALDVTVPAGVLPEAAAATLLVTLKGIERDFGRRPSERWGPREVDLDLLLFGRWVISAGRPEAGRSARPAKAGLPLTVPHVEAQRRLFVLAPLADLAPGLVPPRWGETVASAATRQRDLEGASAARATARWVGDGWAPLG